MKEKTDNNGTPFFSLSLIPRFVCVSYSRQILFERKDFLPACVRRLVLGGVSEAGRGSEEGRPHLRLRQRGGQEDEGALGQAAWRRPERRQGQGNNTASATPMTPFLIPLSHAFIRSKK